MKSTPHKNNSPIGIFDSGVGGLSILRAIRKELPGERAVYLADQAHVPYGNRALENVRTLSIAIARFLINQNAKIIVVACNTASAAALHQLRKSFPKIDFVGMEPAIKPAIGISRSGVVGVLATPATFQGTLYESLVERFAGNVQILQDTCPGLVKQIENGEFNSTKTRDILTRSIEPMIDKGADTLVLGCTHYPFVVPTIKEITESRVTVVDPAPAVARQTKRLLGLNNALNEDILTSSDIGNNIQLYTSGNLIKFRELAIKMLGEDADVKQVVWGDDFTIN